MDSKLIRLQALGGHLRGPLIEVPSTLNHWYVPYRKDGGIHVAFSELDTIMPVEHHDARFASAHRLEILPNHRTAEIFELELP